MNMEPGNVFTHRNIANVVSGTDYNLMSVLQYSVEYLRVKHIIVCGHYECGGVRAAEADQDLGLISGWLGNIRDVYRTHKAELDAIKDDEVRHRRLVDLNVQEQCLNVLKTNIVQKRRKEHMVEGERALPRIHGLVYDISKGELKDVNTDFINDAKKLQSVYGLY